MSLQTSQTYGSGLLQEGLLRGISIPALIHAEADVHPGADSLVRDNLVHFGVRFQGAIDELGFLVGDFLLAGGFVGVGLEKFLEDLAGNEDTGMLVIPCK